MAQKVQTLFVDDLDGSEAEGTVRFGLDGTEYEIDLNARHAQHSETPWPATSPLAAALAPTSGSPPATAARSR